MLLRRKPEIEYRPWESKEWKEIFQKAELRLSKERVYTLAEYLRCALNQDGSVIEMGVYRGCTAYVLACTMSKNLTNVPGKVEKKLYLCDTYEGTPKDFNELKGDINRAGKYNDTSVQYVQEKLKGTYDRINYVVGFIPDSLKQIDSEEKFCFVHIHLNLYESTKDALLWLQGRMSAQGIIIVEDYGISNCKGVRQAVDEQMKMGTLKIIYLPTGQAIIRFK